MSILDSVDKQLESGDTQIVKQQIFDSIIARAKHAYATNQFRVCIKQQGTQTA